MDVFQSYTDYKCRDGKIKQKPTANSWEMLLKEEHGGRFVGRHINHDSGSFIFSFCGQNQTGHHCIFWHLNQSKYVVRSNTLKLNSANHSHYSPTVAFVYVAYFCQNARESSKFWHLDASSWNHSM